MTELTAQAISDLAAKFSAEARVEPIDGKYHFQVPLSFYMDYALSRRAPWMDQATRERAPTVARWLAGV